MPLDRTRCRPLLQSFDFTGLFIDELGWDTHKATHEIPLPDRSVRLEAIAHKRGFVAWHCPTAKGSIFPDAAARRRIIPGVAGTANPATGIPAVNVGVGNNGSPTITLGNTGSNTPAPQPQNTGAPGEISPPIVRPPPSIYLDGSQQQ